MIIDFLAYWIHSLLLLWLTVGVVTIAVIWLAVTKKRIFIISFGLRHFSWYNSLQGVFVVLAILTFIISGLTLLLRPNVFGDIKSTPIISGSNIDAIYVLDLSASMYRRIHVAGSIPDKSAQDCVDFNGTVRIEQGLNGKDCSAITLLDKFLKDNPEINIAVVIFGGAPIIIGPTKDHRALIDSVWLIWERGRSQRFTNATDIFQALVQANLLIKDNTDEIEFIVVSDFEDNNFEQALSYLAEIKENHKVWAVAINSNLQYEDIERIEYVLGRQFTFLVKNPANIYDINIDVSSNPEGYDNIFENRPPANSLSWKNLIGVGMLFMAMICSVLFLRTIRWTKEGESYE